MKLSGDIIDTTAIYIYKYSLTFVEPFYDSSEVAL